MFLRVMGVLVIGGIGAWNLAYWIKQGTFLGLCLGMAFTLWASHEWDMMWSERNP